MIVDGDIVHVVFNVFHSDRLNYEHYQSLFGMNSCLKSIYSLMCVVTSYPHVLLSDYKSCIEDKISALEYGLLNYAKEVEKDVERDLRKTAQKLKTHRNSTIDSNVWGKVMEAEDELFDLAISGKLGENEDNRLEHISASRDELIDNYALLRKIKITSDDEELFDIKLSVNVHQLLSSINADNLDLFYELVLRRNIIHREMFPEKLGPKYEEWLNLSKEKQSEVDMEVNNNTIKLPKELDTPNARKYFAEAIKRHYMENVENDQYHWIGTSEKATKAELAYFLGKVYNYKHSVSGNTGENFPENSLNALFGVTRLYSSLTQVYSAKKTQRWRSAIDAMFE